VLLISSIKFFIRGEVAIFEEMCGIEAEFLYSSPGGVELLEMVALIYVQEAKQYLKRYDKLRPLAIIFFLREIYILIASTSLYHLSLSFFFFLSILDLFFIFFFFLSLSLGILAWSPFSLKLRRNRGSFRKVFPSQSIWQRYRSRKKEWKGEPKKQGKWRATFSRTRRGKTPNR
jgi:hypothetical protein